MEPETLSSLLEKAEKRAFGAGFFTGVILSLAGVFLGFFLRYL